MPTDDKYSTTRNEILDQLAYALGGRVAEELVFHDPTTGASNDIEKATGLARRMVTQFGMSERIGAIKLGQSQGEVFLGRDMGHQRDYSEEVAGIVDEEVRRFIENAHDEAWEILVENRAVLDRLVTGAVRARDPRQGGARRDLRRCRQAPGAAGLALERAAFGVRHPARAHARGAGRRQRARSHRSERPVSETSLDGIPADAASTPTRRRTTPRGSRPLCVSC